MVSHKLFQIMKLNAASVFGRLQGSEVKAKLTTSRHSWDSLDHSNRSRATRTSSQLIVSVDGDEFHDGDWSMNDPSTSVQEGMSFSTLNSAPVERCCSGDSANLSYSMSGMSLTSSQVGRSVFSSLAGSVSLPSTSPSFPSTDPATNDESQNTPVSSLLSWAASSAATYKELPQTSKRNRNSSVDDDEGAMPLKNSSWSDKADSLTNSLTLTSTSSTTNQAGQLPNRHHTGLAEDESAVVSQLTIDPFFEMLEREWEHNNSSFTMRTTIMEDPIAESQESMKMDVPMNNPAIVWLESQNDERTWSLSTKASSNIAAKRGSKGGSKAITRHLDESSTPGFSPSKSERIFISKEGITDDDILCGRGFKGSTHPGNKKLMMSVTECAARYADLGSQHAEKTKLRNSIVDDVRGRFIREEDGRYYLLTIDEARTKVSQSLRDTAPVATKPSPSSPPHSERTDHAFPAETLATEQSCFSPSDTDLINLSKDDITEDDVLCGHEFGKSGHPGNVAYLRLVAENKTLHHSLQSQHGEKTKIRNKIIDQMVDRGCRFIRMSHDGTYHLLTLRQVQAKVSRSLRPRRTAK